MNDTPHEISPDSQFIGDTFVWTKADISEKMTQKKERERLRMAKNLQNFRAKNPDYDREWRRKYRANLTPERKHEIYESQRKNKEKWRNEQKEQKEIKQANLPFIIWDSEETIDRGWNLFGNSEGIEICYDKRIPTEECFELIIGVGERFPKAIHAGFSFEYDVSQILNDLSPRALNALRHFNRCVWNGYEIEHIPHKWFKLKHGNTTVKIFDVFSFFGQSLVDTLTEWNIGPFSPLADDNDESRMVKRFKAHRSTFTWSEINEIREYMNLELKYTKELMEKLRETFLAAGYLPASWHGPGALARMALKKHHVYDAMAVSPVDVQIATRYAYIGGRFSPHLVGWMKRHVFTKDKNSGYPYFATLLPNLSRGKWRRGRVYEPDKKFAVYHIAYDAAKDPFRIYPLPMRDKSAGVSWPHKVTGWFWSPEAELVANDPDATFIEAWIFEEDDPNDRPFKWLQEYYDRRKLLKKTGSPAEYTFKLIINSVYGQLAQRAGWDRKKNKAPRSHQLEWAGWITSAMRAEIYKAAIDCERHQPGSVISIDTDSVTALVPIEYGIVGDELGEWKEKTYTDGIFVQSGIYTLKDKDGNWMKAKSRGLPRGTVKPEILLEMMERGQSTLTMNRHSFTGYRKALAQKTANNVWEDETVEYIIGGGGKMIHMRGPNNVLCRKDCKDNIHRLRNSSILTIKKADSESQPHFLPWLEAQTEMRQAKETGDEWVLDYYMDRESWEITDATYMEIANEQ